MTAVSLCFLFSCASPISTFRAVFTYWQTLTVFAHHQFQPEASAVGSYPVAQITTVVWRSSTPPTKDCVSSPRPRIQCCRCFGTGRLSKRSLSPWGDFSDLSLSKSFCFLDPTLSSLLCNVHRKCSLTRRKKARGASKSMIPKQPCLFRKRQSEN